MQLPATLKQKLYVVARRRCYVEPGQLPYTFSMQSWDPRQLKANTSGEIFICEHEVEVPLPEGEIDMISLEVKAMEKARDEIMGEAQAKATAIDAAIQNLLAIGYEGTAHDHANEPQ